MKAKNETGIGLIEVLVALLVLSTSLLSLATLQAKSLQYNHSSYVRSQANIYAYDILERVRVNRTKMSSYKAALTDAVPSTAASTALEDVDLYEWRKRIVDNFPNGQSAISCDTTTKICTITIKWDEINSSGLTTEDSTVFTYSTRI